MLSLRPLTTLALTITAFGPLVLAGCGDSNGSAKRDQAGSTAGAAVPAAASDGDSDDEPSAPDARIVVMVDESASFGKDLPTAARIITRFIRENAVGGSCEVYLIAIDRSPRILGFYPAEELMDRDSNTILQKISAVTPLDGTDIVGGLQLAATKLNKNNGSKPARRMLLAFTDGYVDPAKQQLPAAKTFPQLSAFNWNLLSGVDTHFYFASSDKEMELTNLMQQHGIRGQVLDASESRKTALSTTVGRAVGDPDD